MSSPSTNRNAALEGAQIFHLQPTRRPSILELIPSEFTGNRVSGNNLSGDSSYISLGSPREALKRMESLTRISYLQDMRSRSRNLIGNSRSFYDWSKSKVDMDTLKNKSKAVKKFYNDQNELIDRLIEIDRLLDSQLPENILEVYSDNISHRQRRIVPGRIDEESQPLLGYDSDQESGVKLAILLNFALNVVLLIGKAAVAFLSNSLSLIASLVDSALDFLSTTIIWFSDLFVQSRSHTLQRAFPVGRARVEPIGVLVFSIIMIISFLQVLIEAIGRLFGEQIEVNLGLSSIFIMLFTIAAKTVAWFWCKSVKSSSVQALVQDAMTDVIFNTFSILFPLIAHFGHMPFVDPLGAVALSLFVIFSWAETALGHIKHLTGAAADPVDERVILYLCARFAESIRQVNSVNAYYVGDNINAEVDVLVDEKMELRDTHDIGEALQYALESLPMVERAFVHMDYRADNFEGHLPH
ncbi:cation efflux family-domain-containing protein [Dipodascopsis uninucleata]